MKFLPVKSVLRDALIIAALSVFGLLVVIGLVDFAAYAVFGVRAPGYGADRFFTHHPRWGQFHRPGASGYWHRYRDGTRFWVEINRHGFADSDRAVAKDRPRIALLGDSTAQFWEAPPEARGHRLLAERLGGEWEVLDFGVRGYGLDQSYLLYREAVRPYRPDIAIVHVCINDVWDHARRGGKPYFRLDPEGDAGIRLAGIPVARPTEREDRTGWRWLLWEYSYSLRRLGLVRHPELKAFYPLQEHFELRPLKRVYDPEDVRYMRLTEGILSRFVDALREDGVRTIIVEMPYRPILTEEGRDRLRGIYGDQFDFEKWSVALQRIAESKEVPFISLPRVIKEHNLNAADLFHPEDQLHVNAKGMQVYADAVLRRLTELHWLTAE